MIKKMLAEKSFLVESFPDQGKIFACGKIFCCGKLENSPDQGKISACEKVL